MLPAGEVARRTMFGAGQRRKDLVLRDLGRTRPRSRLVAAVAVGDRDIQRYAEDEAAGSALERRDPGAA